MDEQRLRVVPKLRETLQNTIDHLNTDCRIFKKEYILEFNLTNQGHEIIIKKKIVGQSEVVMARIIFNIYRNESDNKLISHVSWLKSQGMRLGTFLLLLLMDILFNKLNVTEITLDNYTDDPKRAAAKGGVYGLFQWNPCDLDREEKSYYADATEEERANMVEGQMKNKQIYNTKAIILSEIKRLIENIKKKFKENDEKYMRVWENPSKLINVIDLGAKRQFPPPIKGEGKSAADQQSREHQAAQRIQTMARGNAGRKETQRRRWSRAAPFTRKAARAASQAAYAAKRWADEATDNTYPRQVAGSRNQSRSRSSRARSSKRNVDNNTKTRRKKKRKTRRKKKRKTRRKKKRKIIKPN